MKLSVFAALALLLMPVSSQAIIIPPGGTCCPTCVCLQSKQLLAVPAVFALSTQTDPAQPTDWNRINNAGGWVGLIVAGDSFETASAPDFDLHFAPTHQRTLGYVNTGHGGIDPTTVMQGVANWNLH